MPQATSWKCESVCVVAPSVMMLVLVLLVLLLQLLLFFVGAGGGGGGGDGGRSSSGDGSRRQARQKYCGRRGKVAPTRSKDATKGSWPYY